MMGKGKWGLVALLVLTGCQALPRGGARCQAAAEAARQAVVVTAKGGEKSPVTVALYEKRGERWEAAGPAMDGVAGVSGIAPPDEKREGDGRTPSGIFPLRRAFGYEPLATKIPYLVLDRDMIWIDDPKSPRYNTLATRKEGEGVSFEVMRRDDDLYKYGLVVEYNTEPVVPGRGSAIFFHVWRSGSTPTAGCVALAETDVVRLLQWLDPEKNPVTAIGETGCREVP